MDFEQQVELAAKAIYDYHVAEARKAIDAIPFDPSGLDYFVDKLKSESETAQILIFYSYLDEKIKTLLSLQLEHLDSQAAKERVFGSYGPLGTFSSRVLIAYHLDWISDEQKVRLDAFRKIRNEFAHNAFTVSLVDPSIASQLAIIDYGKDGVFDRMREAVNAVPPPRRVIPNTLANLVLLTLRTFEELLLFPAARTYHVSPGSIVGKGDDQPALMKRVQHMLVKSVLIAAG